MGTPSVQLFVSLQILVKICNSVAAWKLIPVVTVYAVVTEETTTPVRFSLGIK